MSAICGIFNTDGKPVDRELLLKMRDVCDYRGPDGMGLWVDGNVGFGHRLLIVTPESAGEIQPMTDGKGLWIVADCRIDNREELKEKFIQKDRRFDFDPAPDTAYILHAYDLWREDVGNHLLGDFSFAVWNSKERSLFCCRDPLGVKPGFYYRDDKRFIFGSQIKQICMDSSVSKELNLPHLGEFLSICLSDYQDTPFLAIKRIPPASFILVKEGAFSIRRYWNWDPDQVPLSGASLQENGERFRAIFEETVKARLRTTPGRLAGSFLSGGLDSSSIVSMAASLPGFQPEKFPVFSMVFPDADSRYQMKHLDSVDESFYQAAVVKARNLTHSRFAVQKTNPFVNLKRTHWHSEGPLFFPSFSYWDLLLGHISQAGCRVVLHGEGGDEIFMPGSQCFFDSLRRGQFKRFMAELKSRRRTSGTPYATILDNFIRTFLIPDWFKAPFRYFKQREIPPWIRKQFSRKTALPSRAARSFSRRHEYQQSCSLGLHNWILAAPVGLYLDSIDCLGNMNQVEVRMPFLDLRLFYFMASIPADQKVRGGLSKVLLREALRDILPPEVLQRPRKSEFSPAYRGAITKYAKNEIQDFLDYPEKVLTEIVDFPKARAFIEEYLKTNHFQIKGGHLWHLWHIIGLNAWLKIGHEK